MSEVVNYSQPIDIKRVQTYDNTYQYPSIHNDMYIFELILYKNNNSTRHFRKIENSCVCSILLNEDNILSSSIKNYEIKITQIPKNNDKSYSLDGVIKFNNYNYTNKDNNIIIEFNNTNSKLECDCTFIRKEDILGISPSN
jgi:hypothetical protein